MEDFYASKLYFQVREPTLKDIRYTVNGSPIKIRITVAKSNPTPNLTLYTNPAISRCKLTVSMGIGKLDVVRNFNRTK